MLCPDVVRITPLVWSDSPAIIKWLIGDACLSSEYRSCEECGLCLIQNIEVVINRVSAAMWDTIKMNNLPIGGASVFSCPPEFANQEMCRAWTFFYE